MWRIRMDGSISTLHGEKTRKQQQQHQPGTTTYRQRMNNIPNETHVHVFASLL